MKESGHLVPSATQAHIEDRLESSGHRRIAMTGKGTVDYLRKPISLAVLQERVGQRLDRHVAERIKP